MDAKEYTKHFGKKPTQDDLHRVNCTQAGKVGHWQCGICELHAQPRADCGCMAK